MQILHYNKLKSDDYFSRQCGVLNISQPYRPPQPVTKIALQMTIFTAVASPLHIR
jgi:hypothetical protein